MSINITDAYVCINCGTVAGRIRQFIYCGCSGGFNIKLTELEVFPKIDRSLQPKNGISAEDIIIDGDVVRRKGKILSEYLKEKLEKEIFERKKNEKLEKEKIEKLKEKYKLEKEKFERLEKEELEEEKLAVMLVTKNREVNKKEALHPDTINHDDILDLLKKNQEMIELLNKQLSLK